jgi:hypothetical protein
MRKKNFSSPAMKRDDLFSQHHNLACMMNEQCCWRLHCLPQRTPDRHSPHPWLLCQLYSYMKVPEARRPYTHSSQPHQAFLEDFAFQCCFCSLNLLCVLYLYLFLEKFWSKMLFFYVLTVVVGKFI